MPGSCTGYNAFSAIFGMTTRCTQNGNELLQGDHTVCGATGQLVGRWLRVSGFEFERVCGFIYQPQEAVPLFCLKLEDADSSPPDDEVSFLIMSLETRASTTTVEPDSKYIKKPKYPLVLLLLYVCVMIENRDNI